MQAGGNRGERDEVRAGALHADGRHEELRLVADLADELVGRRQDDRVDELQRGRRLPHGHHDADRQHPPRAGLRRLDEPPPRRAPPTGRGRGGDARHGRSARPGRDATDHADFTFTFR